VTIDPGEALLAMTGLRRFMEGDGPGAIEIRRSTQLGTTLREGVRAYLRGRAEPGDRPDVGYVEKLPTTMPEASARAVGPAPDQTETAFTLAAERARQYLAGLVPIRPLPGISARFAQPSHAELAQRRRAAEAVEGPVGLLGRLERLSIDHILALKAVYPTLYRDLYAAVGEEISARARPLTGREEGALSRLLGIPVTGMDMLAAPAPKPPEESQASIKQPDMSTQTERMAAK